MQSVGSLYMLFMHKKCHLAENAYHIKTRLILNDVSWTLSSCVSVTPRFIKENIQERSNSHSGCDTEFYINAVS